MPVEEHDSQERSFDAGRCFKFFGWASPTHLEFRDHLSFSRRRQMSAWVRFLASCLLCSGYLCLAAVDCGDLSYPSQYGCSVSVLPYLFRYVSYKLANGEKITFDGVLDEPGPSRSTIYCS